MPYIFFDKDTDFKGEITTGQLVLEGVVTGNVHASEEVLLKKGSIVHGEIETRKYRIEEGSVHQGKIVMGNGRQNGNSIIKNGTQDEITKASDSDNGHSEGQNYISEDINDPNNERLW